MKLENATTIQVKPTKEGANVDVFVSAKAKSWRFAHDGKKVIAPPFESEGKTLSRWPLFCATTEKECLDEIKRLGLEYKPE